MESTGTCFSDGEKKQFKTFCKRTQVHTASSQTKSQKFDGQYYNSMSSYQQIMIAGD